jgi:type II secretion system protein N
VGLVLFGIGVFFFFLLLKLPEARIQNLIIAHARIIAQNQGLLFSAEKVRIGLLLGPSVKIYNIELKSIENERESLKIPYLRVRPAMLSLLSSTKKVKIDGELLNGELSGAVGASASGFYADVDLDALNLGATPLIKKFLPVQVSATISGRVKLDFDSTAPQKTDGRIELQIDKLTLPVQSLYGFNLPKISVNKSKIDIGISQGQIAVRNFEVGKDIKTDDLVARITGDGQIDRVLERSKINAKAVFELSQSVKQSFPLLETLLASARTPDGKYSYRLNGPISSLEPQPGQ